MRGQRFKSMYYFSIYAFAGANPTIASYNASAVKFYSATSSLVRFENRFFFFYFEKCSSLLQRWRCSCKFKNRRIGSRMEVIYIAINISADLFDYQQLG
jgi:hypothetical protein